MKKKSLVGWIDRDYEFGLSQTNIFKLPSVWKKENHMPYPCLKAKEYILILGKVKRRCKMRLTDKEKKIMEELRKEVESDAYEKGWGVVYLSNCPSASDKSFSGVLASLKKKELYRPYDDGENDGVFGNVKLEYKKEIVACAARVEK